MVEVWILITMKCMFWTRTKLKQQRVIKTYILDSLRHCGVYKSEQQIPKRSGLVSQDTTDDTPRHGQRQMCTQQFQTQQDEVLMLPTNHQRVILQ